MSLPSAEELEKLVAKMRELGVTELGDIKLGPDPKLAQAPSEGTKHVNEVQRAERAAVAHRDTMFAACNIKPKLQFVKGGK